MGKKGVPEWLNSSLWSLGSSFAGTADDTRVSRYAANPSPEPPKPEPPVRPPPSPPRPAPSLTPPPGSAPQPHTTWSPLVLQKPPPPSDRFPWNRIPRPLPIPMSDDDDDEEPPPPPSPPTIARELMDLDLDLDASWPFDLSAFLSGSPPTVCLLSDSPLAAPPQQIPLQLPHFAAPPSPPCLFDDEAAVIAGAPPEFSEFDAAGVPETAGDEIPGNNSNAGPLLVAAAEHTSDNCCVIKEKMTQALRRFKESTDQHVLVQVWAPVKSGDRYVLTTSGQPFVLDPHSTSLSQYRTASVMYLFSADGDGDRDLGLPGRVFRKKLPEWTPDVQYYSSKEYPRLSHALNYNVRGSLALPVFEPSCRACVGVVELIMTSPRINYAHEVDKVCKALEAVNLKSSEILDHPSVQICNEGRQAALAEILEILSVVCETHKLPLAQTWVPCRDGSVLAYGGGPKKSCSSFDGSCMGQICMSTTDAAFYVVDPHMWGFRDACAEHHLQKGQGVSGMAFSLRRPCFSRDITLFCKTEYPLVHYARMFGLSSCLALCLQSSHTGNDDYILEFFLPTNCKSRREQNVLLETISNTIRHRFRSLKVVFESEMQEEIFHEIFHVPTNADGSLEPSDNQDPETYDSAFLEIKAPQLPASPQHDKKIVQNSFEWHLSIESADQKNEKTLTPEESQIPTTISCTTKNAKARERRRGKAEKSISLEVLQQYFAGSLKDAAKSLGVCPTTMKRICRQHGISRWPSRKINKVNRSISKLKRVIESVQGTEGAFNLTSLTACPLPVAVGSHGWPSTIDESQQNKLARKTDDLFEDRRNDLLAQKSSEGDEQSDEHVCQRVLPDPNNCMAELGTVSHGLRTSSSGEESTETPASQGSCQGSPASGNNLEIPFSSPVTEQTVNINGSLVVAFQLAEGANTSADLPRGDANDTTIDPPLGRMLIEDSGSSKDLKNLCHSSGDACQERQTIFLAFGSSQNVPTQEVRTVTIKASYKEDIIRFRIQCNAGILVLKEEVAKRLKLDVGTFDIKYLEDDGEWVLLACDADLEECLEISRLSGGHVIRLSVHDIAVNLGSSCESSWG